MGETGGKQTFKDSTEGALTDLPVYAVVASNDVGRHDCMGTGRVVEMIRLELTTD